MKALDRAFSLVAIVGVGLLAPLTSAQAGYAVLDGAPITQGQLQIAEDDFEKLKDRYPKSSGRFILKETRVDAEISGVLARVLVKQVFQNPYDERLETFYVFPLPENAAIDGYSFQFGETVIRGVVKQRAEARKVYQQARDQGRKAALLEQDRPNVFSQSVANIPPRAEITVHIEYVHPLTIDADNYVFRFPMVVAPRFIPGTGVNRANVGRGWANDTDQVSDASRITPHHLPPGKRNGNDVFINVRLDAGMPIQKVTGVTHEIDVAKTSETEARIALKNQSTIADKDFVVEYRLAGAGTVLASLAHRDEGDGHFALVLQPKWNIETPELTGREVVLMLDTSGSMKGRPISQLRIFTQHVLDKLNPQDSLRIVAFNNRTREFLPNPVAATPQNVEAAKQFVRGLQAGGGTQMRSALATALRSGGGEESRPRYLFLFTDALVGNDSSILGDLNGEQYGDVRVFPIAFGAAPNHYLIGRAAELGRGFAMQVTNQDNPTEIAQRFNQKTASPYMTDVEIDWGTAKVSEVIPARLPDLYAGSPLVIMGRYDEPGSGEIILKGNVLGTAVELKMNLDLPEKEAEHDSLGPLWARQRIRQIWNRDLGRATPIGEDEITQLGLTHQLVTRYTSFVAVEEQAPEQLAGNLRQTAVKVLLPEGMTEAGSGQRNAGHRASLKPGRPNRPRRPAAQDVPAQDVPAQATPTAAAAPRQLAAPASNQAATDSYAAPFSNPAPQSNPSGAASSGSGGSTGHRTGGGGAVEWVFLASIGLMAGGRLRNRRRRGGEQTNEAGNDLAV